MSISPVGGATVSPPSLRAVASGLRASYEATNLRDVLGTFDLLDPDLARALNGVAESGEAVARAGVKKAGLEITGRLLDLLA